MNPLWVLYRDGVANGVATGPSAEKILEQIRAALLGQKQAAVTVTAWQDAPIDDCMRAALGTLLQLTFAAQAQAMAGPGRIVRQ